MLTKLPIIAFIGGGNIARALVKGLLKNNYPRENIVVSDPNQLTLTNFIKSLGVTIAKTNSEAIKRANVVALAVKPQIVQTVCLETQEIVKNTKPLIVSLAAATRLEDISYWLGVEDLGIVRTMTNLSTSVGMGTTAMFPNKFITPSQKKQTEIIFNATGSSFWVDKESDLNMLTPLIGCGPAYLFLLVEAMQKAAIARGIPESLAIKFALETVCGASELAKQSNISVEEMRRNVTTPNGATERSLEPIMRANYFKLFEQAFEQAEKRCNEIEETNHANAFSFPQAKL